MKQIYEVTYQPKDTITDWVYSVSIVKAEKEEDIFKFYENKGKKVLDITPCSEALEDAKKKGKSIIEIESAETKNENNITVKTRQEAWKVADEIFTADYDKDERRSSMAGYPIYTNRINNDQIADLKDRLEITVDSKTTNIWVEDYVEAEEISDRTKLKELIKNNLPDLTIAERLASDKARIVFFKLEGEWIAYSFTLLANNSLSEKNKSILSDVRDADEQAVVIALRDFKKDWEDSLISPDEMAYTVEYRHTTTNCHNNINVFLERVADKEQETEAKTKMKDIKAIEATVSKRCNKNKKWEGGENMLKEIRSVHIDLEKGIYKINGEDIGAYHEHLTLEFTPDRSRISSEFSLFSEKNK